MIDNNKYYIPDIEDLHIGYEMEWLQKGNGSEFVLDGVDKDTWQKWDYAFQGFNIKGIENLIQDNRLRTKYLDKEDIESMGWVDIRDTEKWENREPMYYWGAKYKNAMMGYNPKDNTIAITYLDPCKTIDGKEDEYNYPETKYGQFRGECKSINELRILMKWLHIE